MKRILYWVIGIILVLLFLGFLNSYLIIKSTQTSDDSNKFGLKLGDSKTIPNENDEIKEVPIGIYEDDIESGEVVNGKPPEITPPPVEEDVIPQPTTTQNIKIANWNLQIFGNTKASKPDLLDSYALIIDDYDIIFIQEIRNKDQTAFPKLCALLPDYDCSVSSRAGRTSSKEQYGIIYRDGIDLKELVDFNPDSQDRWERPPIEVTFGIDGYEIIVYNIHTKPTDAEQEIDYLEDIVKTNGNVIVLGDLNADCSYYNNANEPDFENGWHWLIEDNEDTTVSSTDCAYDRIILNDDGYNKYLSDGIYTQISNEESDHYLVWVELEV